LRIQHLKVENYRLLQKVSFKDLTPLTVLSGPKDRGKSTVFDVFAFLNEAFTDGLPPAWHARGGMSSIRSQGQAGPVAFEVAYKAPDFDGKSRLVTYRLEIDQDGHVPVVNSETLRWTRAAVSVRPRNILSFFRGIGTVFDEKSGSYVEKTLKSPDMLAVSALGRFAHPRVQALRDFIQGWSLSYLSPDGTPAIHAADPPAVIGIEEPENQLPPEALAAMAKEIRQVSGRSQVLITTESAAFLSAVRPRELWLMSRGDDGFVSATRAHRNPPQ
jgi:predicted ATPase